MVDILTKNYLRKLLNQLFLVVFFLGNLMIYFCKITSINYKTDLICPLERLKKTNILKFSTLGYALRVETVIKNTQQGLWIWLLINIPLY